MSLMPSSYRNLWALTVLCLLHERQMHPYEMQRLIRQRKSDQFLDLKRGSLYHAIGRLQRAGLIEPVATTREGRRPERTVYRLTEEGDLELVVWLRELLANPARDSTQFFAALSFIAHLEPHDALEHLDNRAGLLDTQVAGMSGAFAAMIPKIGRLVLLELEYAVTMKRAELAWVRALTDDLREGRLNWKPAPWADAPCGLIDIQSPSGSHGSGQVGPSPNTSPQTGS
jgi:DNA-binding PadR family transcriptional regulator